MTTTLLYLIFVFSCATLMCSILGRFRFPYNGNFSFPNFFVAWLTSELAWLHLVIQLALCLWLVSMDLLIHWQTQASIVLLGISVLLLVQMHLLSEQTGSFFHLLLEKKFGKNYLDQITPERKKYITPELHRYAWLKPFRMKRKEVIRHRNIPYGEDARHLLDIYHGLEMPKQPAPVLFYIHGGGWVVGNKEQQALPMIYHLAARGWVVVSINYRLGPKHRFPDPLIDAKRALAWVKLNIKSYGGDPNFVVSSGGSAGGQLALMLALSDQPKWQPDFAHIQTSIAACVPLYPVYDLTNRHRFRTDNAFNGFLTRYVMPTSLTENPHSWDELSPISQLHSAAPPMMIIHGSHDALVPIEEARDFYRRLKQTTKSPSLFAELTGAQHAFEIFHSVRTEYTLDAIQIFLEIIYRQQHAH